MDPFLVLIKIYLAVLQIYFRVWLSQIQKKRKVRLPRIRVKVRVILPPDNRVLLAVLLEGLTQLLEKLLEKLLELFDWCCLLLRGVLWGIALLCDLFWQLAKLIKF